MFVIFALAEGRRPMLPHGLRLRCRDRKITKKEQSIPAAARREQNPALPHGTCRARPACREQGRPLPPPPQAGQLNASTDRERVQRLCQSLQRAGIPLGTHPQQQADAILIPPTHRIRQRCSALVILCIHLRARL